MNRPYLPRPPTRWLLAPFNRSFRNGASNSLDRHPEGEHLMTMKQPRLPGSAGHVAPATDEECTVAVQALCRGRLETKVFGVTKSAARGGREHLALRFGRVLIYIEDTEALDSLVALVDKAAALGPRVFAQPEDAFTEAERSSRRHFERTGCFPKADQPPSE